MEASGSLIFRFPSRLPAAVSARFPDWAGEGALAASGIEQVLVRCAETGSRKAVCLFNPPAELVRRLPGGLEVCAAFDALPSAGTIPLCKRIRVQVPSLAFRSVFRRHGVRAEVVHPKPKVPEDAEEKRKQIRKRLKVSARRLLAWIDERLVSPRLRSPVYEALQQALRHVPQLKGIWVSSRMKQGKNGILVVDPRVADAEQGWVAADILITAASVRQSLAPVHLQFLAAGIPVLTDDAGDHAEWANHLFSGAVISRKSVRKELRHYLERAAADPGWVGDMKHNAKKIARLAAEGE